MFRNYLGKKVKLAGQVIGISLIVFIGVLCLLHFIFGFGIYIVRSGSMEPKINVGDTIITAPFRGTSGSDLKTGTVVSFQDGKALTTHRIVSIQGDSLTTKGDANEDPDPRPVAVTAVKGVYLFRIPYIGYLTYFIRTKLGWFLVIVIPALILFGLIIKDIIKEALKPNPQGKKLTAGHSPAEPTPHDDAPH
jgi:signal peptidase